MERAKTLKLHDRLKKHGAELLAVARVVERLSDCRLNGETCRSPYLDMRCCVCQLRAVLEKFKDVQLGK